MFAAIDENNKKIYIDDAVNDDHYFCPICSAKLIIKKGECRAHHFAHVSRCTDNWHYDMSEWHKWWQNLFPLENQEIVMKHEGEIHRADVFINGVVFEFQHSHLTKKEFIERNEFYTKLGFKIIWIFDAIDQHKEGLFYKIPNRDHLYKCPTNLKCLDGYHLESNPMIEVYFHFRDLYYDNHKLIKIDWFNWNWLKLLAASNEYYSIKSTSELIGVFK